MHGTQQQGPCDAHSRVLGGQGEGPREVSVLKQKRAASLRFAVCTGSTDCLGVVVDAVTCTKHTHTGRSYHAAVTSTCSQSEQKLLINRAIWTCRGRKRKKQNLTGCTKRFGCDGTTIVLAAMG